MRVAVVGAGAVGSRVARLCLSAGHDVTVVEERPKVAREVVKSLGDEVKAVVLPLIWSDARKQRYEETAREADTVILAGGKDHESLAKVALESGANVVSVSDDVDTVLALLRLDDAARKNKRVLVAGAGFSPGLSCVLAVHARGMLDSVEEILVSKLGTGGPECARQHHRALRSPSLNYVNGGWDHVPGGSGRELNWFPDPVGGQDCYYAKLAEPALLYHAFPSVQRVIARVAATRRDQATKWLPMMRKPHPEGLVGALRVEVRGAIEGERRAVVLGVLDRPAVAAATVAVVAGEFASQKTLTIGAGGFASLLKESTPALRRFAEMGLKVAIFEGNNESPLGK